MEIESYEHKCAYYGKRAKLLQERCESITEIIIALKNDECSKEVILQFRKKLEVNSFDLDLLELEGKLENAKSYQKHYSERVEAIKAKDGKEIKECEERFNELAASFRSLHTSQLSNYNKELYYRIMSDLSQSELKQDKKLVLFSLMKQFLNK